MGRFEMLFPVLLAGGIFLLNLLVQWIIRGRPGRQEAAGTPEPQAGEGAGDSGITGTTGDVDIIAPIAPVLSRDLPPLRALYRQQLEPLSAPVPARKNASRLALKLHSRDELRQAVITMTVLKPCRALEPFEPDAGQERVRAD